jgi:pilus assembly protein CpaC
LKSSDKRETIALSCGFHIFEEGIMNVKKKRISCLVATLTIVVFTSLCLAEQAAIPINAFVSKGTILTLKEPSKRVSVSDPGIAEINLISPTQILINGKKVGATTLIIWDMQGNTKFFDVRITGDISQLEQQIKDIAPNDDIKVELANDTIVLSGHATNQQTIDKAIQLAQAHAVASDVKTTTTYAGGIAKELVVTSGKVLNHIIIDEAQQVLLEVKVAQVDKTKLKELGIGVLFQGIGGNNAEATFPGLAFSPTGTIGALDTTETEVLGVGPTGKEIVTDRFLGKSDLWPGITGFDLTTNTPQIGLAHFPSGVALMLKALISKGLAKVLAEPNLTVRSGEKGAFHVGTRFPIQVVQGVGTEATVSIAYEEVGIRLNFAPEVLETKAIRLKVDPAEVSSIIDFVRLQNWVAPIVDTRTVRTSVDLKDGESLILAGLLSDEMKKNIQKVPILGDIPIFGALFRSTSEELRERELVFFITPRLVKPIPQGVKTELPGEKPLTPEQEREFQWIPLPKGSETNK